MLRASGRIVPNPRVIPGATLQFAGLAGTWDGDYYCTQVEYTWGSESFDTYFEVGSSEPDSLLDLVGGSSSPSLQSLVGGLTVGIVTDNADPGSLNRVKLKLPYLSDEQTTGWARVVQLGAGADRGWNILPELDDEVLVGFEHGDIDRPYVLGGLVNGKDKPPYLGADNDLLKGGEVVARTFTSRLGHEIFISDAAASDKQFVRINTSKGEATVFIGADKIDVIGKKIPLKVYNEKGSIEITPDGDIELKGANILLKSSQDITLDAGGTMNIKSKSNTGVTAQGKLDLKANAPATLESAAITTVKGSMVKIN